MFIYVVFFIIYIENYYSYRIKYNPSPWKKLKLLLKDKQAHSIPYRKKFEQFRGRVNNILKYDFLSKNVIFSLKLPKQKVSKVSDEPVIFV